MSAQKTPDRMASLNEPDPWTVPETAFPAHETPAEQIAYLLHFAITAPSGHNTQPWLFQVSHHGVHVFPDLDRALPVVDPENRELAISCGAAIGMFEVAARRFGFDATVEQTGDLGRGRPLAWLGFRLGSPPDPDAIDRLTALRARRTNRAAFGSDIPERAVLETCNAMAADFGVDFSAHTNPEEKAAIAELVADGDRRQFADPAFRGELARWVHSGTLGAHDGMSGTAFGMPDLLAPLARFAIRTVDMGAGVARADCEKINGASPVLAIFATERDGVSQWVQTGRALAHSLVELKRAGFDASYLNQPIEVMHLRPQLKAIVGVKGVPQLLLRIGRGPDQPPSMRRPLCEVLL